MMNFRRSACLIVCLGFTGGDVAWADPAADPADAVVPTAPREANGATARVGTAVGFLYGTPSNVLALGVTGAIGQRFGPLGLEARDSYLSFPTPPGYMAQPGP